MEVEKLTNRPADEVTLTTVRKRKRCQRPLAVVKQRRKVVRTEIETSSSDVSSDSDGDDGDQQVQAADGKLSESQDVPPVVGDLKVMDHSTGSNGLEENESIETTAASEVHCLHGMESISTRRSRESESAVFVTLSRDPDIQACSVHGVIL